MSTHPTTLEKLCRQSVKHQKTSHPKGSKETKVQKQKDNNKKDKTAAMNDTYEEQPASQQYDPAQFNRSTHATALEKLRKQSVKHQKTSHPMIYLEPIPNPAYNPESTKQRY